MHLLHSLSFFVAHFDICNTASHLLGEINVTVDPLSHNNMCQGFEVTPSLTQHPAIILSSAFRLISPHTFDWIFPGVLQLFQKNFLMHLLTYSSLLYTYISQI